MSSLASSNPLYLDWEIMLWNIEDIEDIDDIDDIEVYMVYLVFMLS